MRICFFHVYSSWLANDFISTTFFLNWWVIALGELASMIVGGIIIYWIGKKVDLSK